MVSYIVFELFIYLIRFIYFGFVLIFVYRFYYFLSTFKKSIDSVTGSDYIITPNQDLEG